MVDFLCFFWKITIFVFLIFLFRIIQLLQNLETVHNAFLNPFADYDTRSSEYRRRFQKYSFWGAFLKRCVFGARFQRICVDSRPNPRKNLRFQTKADTRGWGLSRCISCIRFKQVNNNEPKVPPRDIATNKRTQQLPTTPNNMQKDVQTDTTCNIQQCWELLANNVAFVCTRL